MNYKGMMDGWNGDEFEYVEHEDRYYELCDEAYDDWRNEECE